MRVTTVCEIESAVRELFGTASAPAGSSVIRFDQWSIPRAAAMDPTTVTWESRPGTGR